MENQSKDLNYPLWNEKTRNIFSIKYLFLKYINRKTLINERNCYKWLIKTFTVIEVLNESENA